MDVLFFGCTTFQKSEPATNLFCTWVILLLKDDYNVTAYHFPTRTSAAKPWFCHEANNVGVDCVRGISKHIPQLPKPDVLLRYITIVATAPCIMIISV